MILNLSEYFCFSYLLVTDFIFLQNITESFLFQVIFSDNIVREHHVNAIYMKKFIMNDCICTTIFQNEGDYFGGCFRSLNILYRKYIKVKIMNRFSDKTAFGIKIIDYEHILNQIKEIFFYNSTEIKVLLNFFMLINFNLMQN